MIETNPKFLDLGGAVGKVGYPNLMTFYLRLVLQRDFLCYHAEEWTYFLQTKRGAFQV